MQTSPRHRSVTGWVKLAASALALWSTLAPAQPSPLSPAAAAVYQRWVLAMCIGGDEEKLSTDLRRFGPELAPAFARALVAGPADDDLRAVGAAAEARYAQRSAFPLEQFRFRGVDKDALDRFRSVGRTDFVNDEVRRFAQGYKANAVAALGVIGGPVSRELLARLAENRADPLSLAAREALRRRPD